MAIIDFGNSLVCFLKFMLIASRHWVTPSKSRKRDFYLLTITMTKNLTAQLANRRLSWSKLIKLLKISDPFPRIQNIVQFVHAMSINSCSAPLMSYWGFAHIDTLAPNKFTQLLFNITRKTEWILNTYLNENWGILMNHPITVTSWCFCSVKHRL